MAVYYSGARQEHCPVVDLAKGNNLPILEFNVDTVADIKELPALDKCRGGSTAFVINTSQVFMLGESGWTEI